MATRKPAEFMIVNRRSKKALQVTGTGDGQVVEQHVPTGKDDQVWTKEKSGACVKLVNKATGKVLDVMNEGTVNGTWAQTWHDVDGASQVWKILDVTVTYKKLLNVRSGKVLDVVDMSSEDGAPAQIWEDVDGVGQQWKLVQVNKPEKRVPASAAEKKPVSKKQPETFNAKRPQIPEAAPKRCGRPRKTPLPEDT